MAHVRQQVRERAGTILTGLSLTGSNVFESRLYPLIDADLPCILITTDGEEIIESTISGVVQRSILLNIAIKDKLTTDLDDRIDAISIEVETAIANDTSAILRNSALVDVEIELDPDGDQPIGTAKLLYRVQAFTAPNDPETLI